MFSIYWLSICSTWWQRTKKTICYKHWVLKEMLLITSSWKSMNMKWNITFTFERLEAVKVCILTSFYSQAGITQNTVMHLAIFRVFPMQIVGLLEINKRVCRFIFYIISKYACRSDGTLLFFLSLFFSGVWKWCYRCCSVSGCPCGVLQQQVSETVQLWTHYPKGMFCKGRCILRHQFVHWVSHFALECLSTLVGAF